MSDQKIRTFDTGATRDTDVGKLDYEGFLSPLVIEEFAKYMNSHRTQSDGTLRDSDNWQKGIPVVTYMKSHWRHFMDLWKAHRGLPAPSKKESLCAILFNAQGHLHELLKEEAERNDKKPVIEQFLDAVVWDGRTEQVVLGHNLTELGPEQAAYQTTLNERVKRALSACELAQAWEDRVEACGPVSRDDLLGQGMAPREEPENLSVKRYRKFEPLVAPSVPYGSFAVPSGVWHHNPALKMSRREQESYMLEHGLICSGCGRAPAQCVCAPDLQWPKDRPDATQQDFVNFARQAAKATRALVEEDTP